jgi:hypothetical protein
MKRSLLLSLAAAMTASPALATEVADLGLKRGGHTPGAPYDLRISFGSVCCGIDRPALERVLTHVQASRLPTAAERWSWGKEGEVDIGLRFARPADRDALARELLDLRSQVGAKSTSLPQPSFAVCFDAQRKSCK